MPNVEIVLILLLAVALLTTLAGQLGIAYPIVLVLGGLVLSVTPGVPTTSLPPDLVLLLFLPPLLYWESLRLSYRDLRASLRPIANLAVGLVLVTIVGVAVAAHTFLPGFSWATAFVLGTIVGPTDEIAVTTIAARIPLPARLLSLIEDEGLLNDASSLVAYNVAIAAVATGSFSLLAAGLEVPVAAIGGIVVGLAVGWAVEKIRRNIDDPQVGNTFSLLTGYAAYLPANALHLSGVLAVVTTGIYLSRRAGRAVSARTRLQGYDVWVMVEFLANGVLFILVGLQLHRILGAVAAYHPAALILDAAIITVTVIGLRIIWVFASTYLLPLLPLGGTMTHPLPPWQQSALLSWVGMRGAVSLAAALAIPATVNGGAGFPNRDLIIYLTFAVILSTLVLQGLSLPWVIRRLGIVAGEDDIHEEMAARLAATQAGLERLNSSATQGLPEGMVDSLRKQLQHRSRRFIARVSGANSRSQRALNARYRRLLRDVLDAERDAVLDLRDQGIISDDVMRIVEHELDLDEVRLEPGDEGDVR